MRTAVIVATHRRGALFGRLLRNLEFADLPESTEIWAVENGPEDGVEHLCSQSPLGRRVNYLHRAEGNKARALNLGIRESRADFIIFLDDDITAPPDIIESYIAAALRWGPGHFFGGGLTADAETQCPPHLEPYLPRSAKGWCYSEAESEIPPAHFEFFFGANWAAFRSDLEKAGLFAPELGISESKYSSVGEETELQQRMVSNGAKAIYVPRAIILHPVPAECYTQPWLRRRRFRLGVAEWLTRHSAAHKSRPLLGLPLWVIRTLVQQKIRYWGLVLGNASIASKTENIMEQAHLGGLLYGAWSDRLSAPRPRYARADGPSDDRSNLVAD